MTKHLDIWHLIISARPLEPFIIQEAPPNPRHGYNGISAQLCALFAPSFARQSLTEISGKISPCQKNIQGKATRYKVTFLYSQFIQYHGQATESILIEDGVYISVPLTKFSIFLQLFYFKKVSMIRHSSIVLAIS